MSAGRPKLPAARRLVRFIAASSISSRGIKTELLAGRLSPLFPGDSVGWIRLPFAGKRRRHSNMRHGSLSVPRGRLLVHDRPRPVLEGDPTCYADKDAGAPF
eukprot:scaffold563625_cov24-Prasinocladus_malaysianus.AAC.1